MDIGHVCLSVKHVHVLWIFCLLEVFALQNATYTSICITITFQVLKFLFVVFFGMRLSGYHWDCFCGCGCARSSVYVLDFFLQLMSNYWLRCFRINCLQRSLYSSIYIIINNRSSINCIYFCNPIPKCQMLKII